MFGLEQAEPCRRATGELGEEVLNERSEFRNLTLKSLPTGRQDGRPRIKQLSQTQKRPGSFVLQQRRIKAHVSTFIPNKVFQVYDKILDIFYVSCIVSVFFQTTERSIETRTRSSSPSLCKQRGRTMVANQEWCVCKYCRRDMPGTHSLRCPLAGPIGPLSERAIRLWNSGWYDGYYKLSYDDDGYEYVNPPRSNHPAYMLGWAIGEGDLEIEVERAVEQNYGYESDDEYPRIMFS